MLRAHGAQGHHHATAARAAGGVMSRNAWMILLLAGVAMVVVANVTNIESLDAMTVAFITGGIALTARRFGALERQLDRCEAQAAANARRIGSYGAGLDAAARYALRGGGDGSAACPMGGGPDCPQLHGHDYAAGAGPYGNMASFLRSLDNGAAGRSFPGGF